MEKDMQGQTKAGIAITSVKLLVVWGTFGAMLAKVVLEDGFDASAGVTARGVQAGALLAALLSVGCYAMILRWRRLAMDSGLTPDAEGSAQDHQDFFHARATWFCCGAIGLLLVAGAVLGTTKTRETLSDNGKRMAATAKDNSLPSCKFAGMVAYQMASKRDQGVSKEEMKRRYRPNEVMDTKAWGLMVDMVYNHPERNPETFERAFASEC